MTVIAWLPVKPFRTGIAFWRAGALPSTGTGGSYPSPVKMYSSVPRTVREEETIIVPISRPNVPTRRRDRRRNAFRTAIRASTRCVPARTARATATAATAIAGRRISRISGPHLLDDLPVLHLQDPVGPRGDRRVVGHDDERLSVLPVEPFEEVHDLRGRLAVQVPRRLVRPHDRGLVRERAGDRDALLLPRAQLRRLEVRELPEADEPEEAAGDLPRLAVRDAADEEGKLDVLPRR